MTATCTVPMRVWTTTWSIFRCVLWPIFPFCILRLCHRYFDILGSLGQNYDRIFITATTYVKVEGCQGEVTMTVDTYNDDVTWTLCWSLVSIPSAETNDE